MKVNINFTIEIDAEQYRKEYATNFTAKEIREALREDARQGVTSYLDGLDKNQPVKILIRG